MRSLGRRLNRVFDEIFRGREGKFRVKVSELTVESPRNEAELPKSRGTAVQSKNESGDRECNNQFQSEDYNLIGSVDFRVLYHVC